MSSWIGNHCLSEWLRSYNKHYTYRQYGINPIVNGKLHQPCDAIKIKIWQTFFLSAIIDTQEFFFLLRFYIISANFVVWICLINTLLKMPLDDLEMMVDIITGGRRTTDSELCYGCFESMIT